LGEVTRLNQEAEKLRGDGKDAEAEEKIKARNQFIDDHSGHWTKLKPWLLALSYGKCWFSESKDTYSHYEVEHFRPKKFAKNLDDSVRDGYWWLAFEYSNFRICGNVGNRKKGGWFPLQSGSLCSSYAHQCEESESPYLLDPTDPDDVCLVAFDEEGKVIPAPGASEWEARRVEISIDCLKLNAHEALTEARKTVWQAVCREIEGYLSAKARCCSGCNPAAKEKLRRHAQSIRKMVQAEAPLSSVVRWCLSFRNDPGLLRLVF
jgi:uncharacterized protein (TIGR02646 family)